MKTWNNKISPLPNLLVYAVLTSCIELIIKSSREIHNNHHTVHIYTYCEADRKLLHITFLIYLCSYEMPCYWFILLLIVKIIN